MNVFLQGATSVIIIAMITAAIWLLWHWINWLNDPWRGAYLPINGKRYEVKRTTAATITTVKPIDPPLDTEISIRAVIQSRKKGL